MIKARTDTTRTTQNKEHKENKLFYYLMSLVCLDLFFFNLWLFYPGYVETDWAMVIAYLGLDNHYPVIYPFLLQYIFSIFGKHIYIPLLFNLIPLYLGIYVLMTGCWQRFRSKWCLLSILPLCVGNIYFNNIILHSSFSSPMLIFLLWMLVLYQILVGITYKNSIALILSFIFATISRHNAIIQVYPVFLIYAYLIVNQRNSQHQVFQYIGWLSIFAIITVITAIGVPQLLKDGQKPISTTIFLHQIAGACVPNHDETCFKPEWYIPGKNYKDVEKVYTAEPLDADYMSTPWKQNCPFQDAMLPELKTLWLKAILKYPTDYGRHTMRFIKELWVSDSITKHHLEDPHYSPYITNIQWLKSIFSAEELFYKPSLFKIKIYNFLYAAFLKIKTTDYIVLNFVLFFVLSILFLKRKNILLLYGASASLSGIGGAVIFAAFSPIIAWRYIYPVLISTVITVIGIVLYIIDEKKRLQEKNPPENRGKKL